MADYNYVWESEVRDYELDAQGIVNNSVYVNYLEQCRNKYVKTIGVDIHEFHKQGYNLVVSKLEINYKKPLSASQQFYVTASMRREGRLKTIFDQEIRVKKSNVLIVSALVTSLCVNIKTGKPSAPEILENVFRQVPR